MIFPERLFRVVLEFVSSVVGTSIGTCAAHDRAKAQAAQNRAAAEAAGANRQAYLKSLK